MAYRNAQIFILLTVTTFGIPLVANAGGYLTSVGKGEDKIPVVVVRGTPYEMGRAQGKLIKDDARALIKTFLDFVQAKDQARYSDKDL